MNIKVNISKLMLSTIGKMLPLRRHPGGGIANRIRVFFAKGIVKSVGEGCNIESGAELQEDCVLGDHTGIGPNSLVQQGTIFKGFCMMGPDVHIYTTGHKYNKDLHRFDGMTEVKPVTIGKNVWIGYGVIILPGVTIGDNTIIGAGSVVSKNIPSGVMAAGNPCVVKKVIDEEIHNSEIKA